MSGSVNQDQKRAAFAWKQVNPEELAKDYKVLAKSAPALIMNNGLMQTLAYYEDKGKTAAKLQQHICLWLQERGLLLSTDYVSVMTKLHGLSSQEYRMATDESLKILRWIRQFAATRISN